MGTYLKCNAPNVRLRCKCPVNDLLDYGVVFTSKDNAVKPQEDLASFIHGLVREHKAWHRRERVSGDSGTDRKRKSDGDPDGGAEMGTKRPRTTH